MRQAGIIAAAGLYALEHNVERLAEDHANAKLIADELDGLSGRDGAQPVGADQHRASSRRARLQPTSSPARLAREGVLVSTMGDARDSLRDAPRRERRGAARRAAERHRRDLLADV